MKTPQQVVEEINKLLALCEKYELKANRFYYGPADKAVFNVSDKNGGMKAIELSDFDE